MALDASVRLSYLGWSGFRLTFSENLVVYVDPPEAPSEFPEGRLCLAISHGHPEHVAGALNFLSSSRRQTQVRVLASEGVCRFLRRRSARKDDVFDAARPGQTFEEGGLGVDVVGWRHMCLLPPGFRAGIKHMMHLASRPHLALGIALAGLRGPRPGPMLGFRFVPREGPRIFYYGEGLHRRTGLAAVAHERCCHPAEVLVFAAEPEDAPVLPDLVGAFGVSRALPFPAHRRWREDFGLPLSDLETLKRELALRKVQTNLLNPGESLTLGAPPRAS